MEDLPRAVLAAAASPRCCRAQRSLLAAGCATGTAPVVDTGPGPAPAGTAAAALPAPPSAPQPRAHADTAHGVVIPDEYRWMETAGAALDPWIDAEDAHARAVLATLPGRAALRERVAELWRTGAGDVAEIPAGHEVARLS